MKTESKLIGKTVEIVGEHHWSGYRGEVIGVDGKTKNIRVDLFTGPVAVVNPLQVKPVQCLS